MSRSDSPAAYGPTAKVLHWLVVALLVAQFVVAWTMPEIHRNTKPETLINLHLSLGMVTLLVVVIRLAWRWTHPEPAPLDGLPPWQAQSARVVHYALYAVLVVAPILGWMNASFRGFPIVLFGIQFPALMAPRTPGFAWTGDVHALISNYLLLALVGLHLAATLYHRLVRKDGVLARMLPQGWAM